MYTVNVFKINWLFNSTISLKIAYNFAKKKKSWPILINNVGNQAKEYIFTQKKKQDVSMKYSYFLLEEHSSSCEFNHNIY